MSFNEHTTQRWAMGLSYLGTPFEGWQAQHHTTQTVQTQLQQALERVAQHPVQVVCAGRTDKGVHAQNQIIHFDTTAQRLDYQWIKGANTYLPSTIRIRWAKSVPNTFHARFSAIARRYHYWIFNQKVQPAILQQHITWIPYSLDFTAMQKATQCLIGEHDFQTFRDAACQAKSSRRHVTHCRLEPVGPYLRLDIQANAFLHHMVRNIMGTLLWIGVGKYSWESMQTKLLQLDRRVAGPTAPPQGLHLVQVLYPDPWSHILPSDPEPFLEI